jgi:hypothetical protein
MNLKLVWYIAMMSSIKFEQKMVLITKTMRLMGKGAFCIQLLSTVFISEFFHCS